MVSVKFIRLCVLLWPHSLRHASVKKVSKEECCNSNVDPPFGSRKRGLGLTAYIVIRPSYIGGENEMAECDRTGVVMEPVGPWKCATCGRELLLIVDSSAPSGNNGTIRDQCGTEHFVPGRALGFFFRTQDGNWVAVPEPQADEDAHVKGE